MSLLLGRLSPAGAQARLSILIFHRVQPQPDPMFPEEIDAKRFDALCGWMSRWCRVLPLDEAVRRLHQGDLPDRAAAITFDDGYEDNASVAQPILARHGLSATFFVATDFLDGGIMWNDVITESLRRCPLQQVDLSALPGAELGSYRLDTWASRGAAVLDVTRRIKYLTHADRLAAVHALCRLVKVDELPSNLMMSSEQVRGLRRSGMVVGAHTGSHPILAQLPIEAARTEVLRSKQVLESLLNEPVGLFAYPNGRPGTDYVDTTVAAVRDCGFDAAVSTVWGAANATSDPFQLPRFTPWDRTPWRFGLRLAQNLRRSPN